MREFVTVFESRLDLDHLDLDQQLTEMLRILGDVLPCDRCFLYVRDPATATGKITHCWSVDGQTEDWVGADWLEDPSAPIDPLMTLALADPTAVFVADIETAGEQVVNLAYEQQVFRHRALIHAPIYDADSLIGILECSVFQAPRVWTDRDRQLIRQLQQTLPPLVAEVRSSSHRLSS